MSCGPWWIACARPSAIPHTGASTARLASGRRRPYTGYLGKGRGRWRRAWRTISSGECATSGGRGARRRGRWRRRRGRRRTRRSVPRRAPCGPSTPPSRRRTRRTCATPWRAGSRPPCSTGCGSTPSACAPWRTGSDAIADLPDPVGRELARWARPNGLDIARVAVPLGVIGIVYESRPNVTADAGGLCLKAGNAASCAAARRASAPPAPSSPACARGSRPPACRRPPSSSCRPPTAPPSATCCGWTTTSTSWSRAAASR